MSWEPISKTLGSVIDERLSSPLISTFVISWSLINYKFFVILFSDESVTKTFDLIEDTFWKKKCVIDWGWEYCTPWTQFFILPTIATALYLFVLPRPARWVYELWRANQKKTNDIRDKYESEQKISVAESQSYRRKQRELEDAIDTHERKAEQLTRDLRRAEADLKEVQSLGPDDGGLLRRYDELELRYETLSKKHDAMYERLVSMGSDDPAFARNYFNRETDQNSDQQTAVVLALLRRLRAKNAVPSDFDVSKLQVIMELSKLDAATAAELLRHFSPRRPARWLTDTLRELVNAGLVKEMSYLNSDDNSYSLSETGIVIVVELEHAMKQGQLDDLRGGRSTVE